jgi:hypothetical protein
VRVDEDWLKGRTAAERALFHVCRCGHYRYLHTGAWWQREEEDDVGLPCRRPIGVRGRVPPCDCKGFKRDRKQELEPASVGQPPEEG